MILQGPVTHCQQRGLTTLGVPIKVVGVWDTVGRLPMCSATQRLTSAGSLGIPRIGLLEKLPQRDMAEYAFYDTSLSNSIENAFQALALDERRQPYQPAVWEKLRGNETVGILCQKTVQVANFLPESEAGLVSRRALQHWRRS